MTAFILLASLGVMIATKLHTELIPQFHTAWFLNTSRALRNGLIPALIVSGGGAVLASYAVLLISNLNHDLNRVRTIQIWSCVALGTVSVLTALIWLT